MAGQILRVQVPDDKPFVKYTSVSKLISVDTVHNGLLTELTYSIGMKKSNQVQAFLTEIRNLNGNNRVTLIAGYQNCSRV